MENPLLDSNIIDKNNRDYVLFAKVSKNDETLRILIEEMQLKIKFTSDNKTYLKCQTCELLYVLQYHNNLQMSIFYKKHQKNQKDNSSNNCQQCQQFINGECFKKCYKCNSKQIICIQNEQQRLQCQICFSELCKNCDSNLEIFQQFPDTCTQKNVTNCQRYFYVITMIIMSFIFLPIFMVLNFQKYKFQCQFLQFHQYILTKYKPVIILFFYQVFLIVYLVKVFMILINFVVDKNKERIHYYFG
ncbi:unnamed protein product [Paramecium pentaurelia]|uniref:Transmembrane protein n=1 Tax=Paramecium pentaurelia TaxID=43138 RepID=A0A8S1UG34_9CILI|nr:unnamed protein product [Paramecium pentaurelia]